MNLGSKICVISNGCPESRIDAAGIREFIRENGWTLTSSYRKADLIVFNACGATIRAYESSLGIIEKIGRRKKANSRLIVCGCITKINKELIESGNREGVGVHYGTAKFLEITGTNIPSDLRANYLVPIMFRWNIPSFSNIASFVSIPRLMTRIYHLYNEQGVNNITSKTYCVKIATGCSHACSFCAIRLSRGKVTSKSPDEVVSEFKEGIAGGYKDFTLIATDLGSYGMDNGSDLCDLLKQLVDLKGDYRIKLQYIHPRFLIDMLADLRRVLKSGKISYLCSAAESGNNRILGLMRRQYKTEEFRSAVISIRNEFPEIKMSTQVMVAFPGEKEAEFDDTVRMLDETNFDFVEAYIYQPRPNTAASGFEDRIPSGVARNRLLKLYFTSIFRKYRVFVW